MRLTILGKSPAWSDAGGACSGYLIEEGSTTIVLDCGNGAFGKLRRRVDYRDVDAAVISHLHGDHLLDLVPFSYALTLGPGAAERTRRPRLIAPVGADAFFRRLAGTWGDEELIIDAFELEEYEPGGEATVGDVSVRSHPVPHIGPTHAIELTSPSGGRIVFGADGRYSDELIAAARGADLLVAEATLPDLDPSQDVHMSAEETGRLAREAGVGRLVLTHISDELDTERSRRIAAEEFGGEVEVAAEGLSWDV
jgi:ribonuclease BN (tRNA processing enzyme)